MKCAFVGVPCDIQALRKVEALSNGSHDWVRDVDLKVGLFCRENWAFSCFRALIKDDYGTQMGDVKKFDIKKGKIIGYKEGDDTLAFPLGRSHPYVRVGCQVCLDFAAELADISVGAVGTPDNYSTVVARNQKGKEIVEGAAAAGYIEIKDIEDVKPGVGLIKKLTDSKRSENLEEAQGREKTGFAVHHIKTMGDQDMDKTRKAAEGKDFSDLDHDVIENGLCVVCGTCEAVCNEGCVKVVDEHPKQVGECAKGCNDCYLMCPRTSLPQMALETMAFGKGTDRVSGVGVAARIYAAKAMDSGINGQDGGAVTAILSYAMDKGLIDGVLSTKSADDDPWRPEAVLSRTKDELLKTAGTIYSHAVLMPSLRGALK